MNIQELRESGYIIYECITGSHSYGTNTETSDIDKKGIYIYPEHKKTIFLDHQDEVSDNTEDTKFYELRKFMLLAAECNPNIIELLWTPGDLIIYKNQKMYDLMRNRNLFISQKARHTFAGYAHAQIEKAKGKNKKVNNPQPKERPTKEDFCKIIPVISTKFLTVAECMKLNDLPPFRPIPLKEWNINLQEFHCARVEHTSNLYRLYYYGTDSKGVFRGDDALVPESIPLEDEHNRYYGLLLYNHDMYVLGLKEWKSYWEWMEKRNESRWVDQEKGLLDYDQKNMMHCVRLLLSGINILKHGEPIIRFTNDQLKYLMDIRTGKFKYEELMQKVERLMEELEQLKGTTNIPYSSDPVKINELYKRLIV